MYPNFLYPSPFLTALDLEIRGLEDLHLKEKEREGEREREVDEEEGVYLW